MTKPGVSLFVVGLLAAIAGFVVRCFLPPFVLDDPFWRSFWSGPPAAGIFALVGAGVAFGAAWLGARNTRRSALRDEWWERTEWALTQAMSDDPLAKDVGLAALEVLNKEATPTESDMIAAVTSRHFLPGPPQSVEFPNPGDGS